MEAASGKDAVLGTAKQTLQKLGLVELAQTLGATERPIDLGQEILQRHLRVQEGKFDGGLPKGPWVRVEPDQGCAARLTSQRFGLESSQVANSWKAMARHPYLTLIGSGLTEFGRPEQALEYLLRRSPSPADAIQRWLAFLKNHREAIVALDFFTVPTLTFRLLYCFFVIDHHRRRILHFNVTAHPTAEWVCQQLREAFPDASPCKYVILDRDTKFSAEVLDLLKSSGIEPKRTSFRSPWQNGVAERWVGSSRRECFDHVVALNEPHVRRIAREFIAYYHEDRTHLGLDKDTPAGRPVESKPAAGARVESLSRVGGLHHRYVWKAAA